MSHLKFLGVLCAFARYKSGATISIPIPISIAKETTGLVLLRLPLATLMNHLLYSERKANREMWITFTEAAKQHGNTEQENP
jgi:hypothetical protein